MTNKTDVNFDYIPGKRYIIEIKDEETGRIHLSKRITFEKDALQMLYAYNRLKGMVARLFDTKSGYVIAGDKGSY